MWFLPTRNRPQECIELVAAFKAVGDVPPVAVMIDDDPAKYADVPWPGHWGIHVAPEHLEMGWALNMLLEMYPGEPCYGWFGDHFRPTMPMFDELRDAAGDWFMAWPVDALGVCWGEMSGAPTFGGKLIRELGWLALPSLIHVSTECPYTLMWGKIGNAKVLGHLTFDRTWPLGFGVVPRTYNGIEVNGHDAQAYYRWLRQSSSEMLWRVREAMRDDGYDFTEDGFIHPKYGCSKYGAKPYREPSPTQQRVNV